MIKAIIERRCRPNKEEELDKLLLELRGHVMKQAGYYSGETLRGLDDPSLWLVISTWNNDHSLRDWINSPMRREFSSKLESLLEGPEKITVVGSMRPRVM